MMPGLTLETISPDIILQILFCFNSYHDLDNLINASPACYRVYSAYPDSTWKQLAKNIVGKDAWEDAAAVLVYQRHANCEKQDYRAIKKDLESRFTLDEEDVQRLMDNHEFFRACALDFASFGFLNYPRREALEKDKNKLQVSMPDLAVLNNSPFTTNKAPSDRKYSFTAGDPLPAKLFYKVWHLSLQFGFDSIETFVRREPISDQQHEDLYVVCKIIHSNHLANDYVGFGGQGSSSTKNGVLVNALFRLWVNAKHWMDARRVKNPLLLLKMMGHCLFSHGEAGDIIPVNLKNGTLHRLTHDYVVKGLSKDILVKKYKLSRGWE